MKYIIIILPNGDDQFLAELATRKQFDTRCQAEAYVSNYDPTWQSRAMIVACPKGVTPHA